MAWAGLSRPAAAGYTSLSLLGVQSFEFGEFPLHFVRADRKAKGTAAQIFGGSNGTMPPPRGGGEESLADDRIRLVVASRRRRRGNPWADLPARHDGSEVPRGRAMDCFVAALLAMTRPGTRAR
jgi:hypothetical protein